MNQTSTALRGEASAAVAARAGGLGIAGSVLGFFSLLFDGWPYRRATFDTRLLFLAILATLLSGAMTYICVRKALAAPVNAGRRRRVFAWSILPPIAACSWTLIGMIPAAIAGLIAALALIPLVETVHAAPREARSLAAAWLAFVALLNAYSPAGVIIALAALGLALSDVRAVPEARGRRRTAVAIGVAAVAASVVLTLGRVGL